MDSSAPRIRTFDGVLEEQDVLTYDGQAKKHIELLYREAKGKVALITIDDRLKQRFYITDTLLKKINKHIGQENIFVSQNTFYKNSRKIEDIKCLCALYSDIDCYKLGLTKEQVLWQLEQDYYNKKIPIPSLIIDSGRGLYLNWFIRPVPTKALPLWKFTQDYFHDVLKEFGADPISRDASRFFRLSGTVNPTSGSTVEILEFNDYVYTINEIQEEFLPEKPVKKQKKEKRKVNVTTLKNIYNLHYLRFQDLKTLVQLRNGYMPKMREISCFLYRYWQCCFVSDPRQALEETIEFNKLFWIPLKEKEVIRNTKSAETAFEKWLAGGRNGVYKRGGYNYKNDTLIELLNIKKKEEKKLQTIISTDEKYSRKNKKRREDRRNDKGLTSRQIQRKENIDRILSLLNDNPDILQKEIAEKIGISQQMVSLYLKEIRKNKENTNTSEMGL